MMGIFCQMHPSLHGDYNLTEMNAHSLLHSVSVTTFRRQNNKFNHVIEKILGMWI
jgi:hypothetical protein